MRIIFDRYNNGNLKVLLEIGGVSPLIEVSRCLDTLPQNVAYICNEYLEKVLSHTQGKVLDVINYGKTAIEFVL